MSEKKAVINLKIKCTFFSDFCLFCRNTWHPWYAWPSKTPTALYQPMACFQTRPLADTGNCWQTYLFSGTTSKSNNGRKLTFTFSVFLCLQNVSNLCSSKLETPQPVCINEEMSINGIRVCGLTKICIYSVDICTRANFRYLCIV